MQPSLFPRGTNTFFDIRPTINPSRRKWIVPHDDTGVMATMSCQDINLPVINGPMEIKGELLERYEPRIERIRPEEFIDTRVINI